MKTLFNDNWKFEKRLQGVQMMNGASSFRLFIFPTIG